MSNAKTLHLQFADGEIEVGTIIDALYEQDRTIAILRQHKTDYMEAAEGTRKALLSELSASRLQVAMLATCCGNVGKERDALAAELAAIRAAGGEQVEVVAHFLIPRAGSHAGERFAKAGIPSDSLNSELYTTEPLMTVAQHQRIVAAMAAELGDMREKLEVAKTDELNAAVWAETESIRHDMWDAQRERDALRTQLEAIRAAGGEVRIGQLPEINFSNYGEDEVQALQSWAFEAHDALAAMAAELEHVTKQRDAILQQARIWAMEAKTQRSTVLEVGEILGGVPDWGPIAAGVEAMRAELEAARKQEPVATLHADGYWSWTDYATGKQRYDASFAAFRLSVYALPPLAGQVSVPRELLERLLNALDKGFPCIQVAEELRALLATPSMEVKHGD